MNTKTVYIVDDDVAVRDGIVNLVVDMGLTAEAYGSAEEFLDSYEDGGVGCLVLDMRMPGMGGMELLAKLVEKGYAVPVIVVTGHGDVPMAVEAIGNGAMDFIEKPFREQVLWERIQKALKVSEDSSDIRAQRGDLREKMKRLTAKECEVLNFLVDGQNDKEIADETGVTRRAVAFHRSSVLKKMGARNTVEMLKLITRLEISAD